MAYNLLLPPKSVAVILRKGVKGRKKNLMDQRTKQMVRLKAVEPSQFSRKFALEGCAELVISRGGEGREGVRWKEGCGGRLRRMLERRVSTRFSCEILLEEHFSALHSYFGSKSSGLIKMGRGLYTPSTRGAFNPTAEKYKNGETGLDEIRFGDDPCRFIFYSITYQNFYLLLLFFFLNLNSEVGSGKSILFLDENYTHIDTRLKLLLQWIMKYWKSVATNIKYLWCRNEFLIFFFFFRS